MFIVSQLEDYVSIAPQYFDNEGEAAEIEISKKYANKVLRGIGLIISVYSIDNIESGFVYTGQGSCHSKVTFKLTSFLPYVGELITGVIRRSNENSITGTII